MLAHFHFTENALTLHLFLQRAQCLIDIIITNRNFYQRSYPLSALKAQQICAVCR